MINRRRLMAATLGGAMTGFDILGRGPSGAAAARAAVPLRIVVVGAGLAGLQAAMTLQAEGHEVVVLEARPRIGGRVHTSMLWPDMPIDLGAAWIHGLKDNPVARLARAAGMKWVETSYEYSAMIAAGRGAIDPDLEPARRLLEAARREAEDRERDLSVLAAVTGSKAWKRASAQERRLARHLINGMLEQEYSGAADRLSAWWFDDDESFEGMDALFPGGYSRLAEFMARGLDIRTGSPVVSVAPGEVELADGRLVEADRIILTVPLGVLKAGQIRFAEPLSKRRQTAIDRLEMGLLNKAILRFDKPAWPVDVDWLEWLPVEHGPWTQFVSMVRGTGWPVLIGFNAGNEAAAIEKLDDRATLASAMEALRSMFGNAFPEPVAVQLTRWGQEEWTLGSYSFNAVGTDDRTRDALAGADWDGMLCFAGEACSRHHFGSAHGALLSAAKAVDAMAR